MSQEHAPGCPGCQIVGLIDRAEKAEAKVARVEAVLSRPDTTHSHLVTVAGVRAALEGPEI